MTLESSLDSWAETLSAKSKEKDTPLQESIDAFKAVTAYYAARQKNTKKSGDDEPGGEGFSFAESGEVVNGTGGQRSEVRAGRNS